VREQGSEGGREGGREGGLTVGVLVEVEEAVRRGAGQQKTIFRRTLQAGREEWREGKCHAQIKKGKKVRRREGGREGLTKAMLLTL